VGISDIVLQGTPTTGGATALIGKSRCGKTTKAVELANETSRATGYPKAVMDLGAAASFKHLPHAVNVDEVLTSLYVKREDARIWTPETPETRAKFFKAVHAWGAVILVLDEVWNICSSYYVDEDFVTLSNQYAHGHLGTVYLYYTAQRIIYINPKLYAAINKWLIYKSAKGAEQDTLYRLFGVDPKINQALGRGQYEEFSDAFEDAPPAPGSVPPGVHPANPHPPLPSGAGAEESGDQEPRGTD
jgi:hypothetical protein